MENRELTMDDYLAMFRRRIKVILIPALLAPLAGFIVSYAFSPKYTSQSLVLVEAPKIPDAVVQQVFTEDLTQHIATIEQQVLSPSRLRPMVDRWGLAKGGQNVDDVMDNMLPNYREIDNFTFRDDKLWDSDGWKRYEKTFGGLWDKMLTLGRFSSPFS